MHMFQKIRSRVSKFTVNEEAGFICSQGRFYMFPRQVVYVLKAGFIGSQGRFYRFSRQVLEVLKAGFIGSQGRF